MRAEQDHYDVLGLSRGASDREIKRAFRELARRLHPDVAPDGAPEHFYEVVAAYEVLSHPKRRSLYDRLRPGARRARPAPAVPPLDLRLEWWEAQRGTAKPIELEEALLCEACDGRRVARGVEPASCIACHGNGRITRVTETAELRLLEVQPCAACGGKGHDDVPACERCGGRGRTTAARTIRVRIPAGVRDGDLLRVDGVPQNVRLLVGARPRDSRALLAVSGVALLAAIGLLLYLVAIR